ncbi:hypothetical protein CRG98_034141 [Punica granatum]|uniref:Uncharacterized protein n=1 Tax=Punica granatum TaxID=22663 RepID=A0A2I0IPY0_PUNGR|nr:hypothetical protein CRG98_034141 [Punica granatum]
MLPYLQAIIKETLRLYPVVQLSVSHEANRDCGISGYFIPKGTRVVLNLYKLQHDPRVWPNPSEFQPDRFLTTYKVLMSGDITSTSYLLGAGGGRALVFHCPCKSLASRSLLSYMFSIFKCWGMRPLTWRKLSG